MVKADVSRLDVMIGGPCRFWHEWTPQRALYVQDDGNLYVRPQRGASRFINDPTDRGVMLGMPNATYHAETAHVSSSSLKLFIENPVKYARHFVGRRNDEAYTGSAAKSLGSLVHAILLEPETVEGMYEVELTETPAGEPINKHLKDHRFLLECQALAAREQGRIIVSSEDMATAFALAGTIEQCGPACEVLDDPLTRREVAFFVHDPDYDLRLKMLTDLLHLATDAKRERPVIHDIKTSLRMTPDEFTAKDVPMFDYDLSAAFYRRVFWLHSGVVPDFRWIVLAKDTHGGYHQCYTVELHPKDMETVDNALHHHLKMLGQAQLTDRFVNPYSAQVTITRLPGYRFSEFRKKHL